MQIKGMKMIEIEDIHIPELSIYLNLNETQLLHYYEPELGIFIAESPNVIIRALDAGCEPISMLCEARYLENETAEIVQRCAASGKQDIPVYVGSNELLRGITGFSLTRGILCAMRRKELPNPLQLVSDFSRIVILEDVVNPTNVGAIFRSAAALGMDAVLLTRPSSDPLYRRASRVSMGTVFQIPWTYLGEDEADDLKQLREMGYRTVAMALCEDSVNINDPSLRKEEKLAVIMGTEGEGLKQETISACDYTVCIPMTHGVDSLNVAAASAVAFWELGRN